MCLCDTQKGLPNGPTAFSPISAQIWLACPTVTRIIKIDNSESKLKENHNRSSGFMCDKTIQL